MTRKLEPFRLSFFSLAAILLLALVYYLSPVQLPIVLHKLSVVMLGGILGYWLDRHMFPNLRPSALASGENSVLNTAMLRRAIVVGACLVAVAIAL